MITWNAGISPAKKIARARSSVASSRNTPEPADRRAPHARAGQQLAPPPGAAEVGHVDRLGVEGDPRRPQARDRLEDARAGHVELDQQVLASLGRHVLVLSPKGVVSPGPPPPGSAASTRRFSGAGPRSAPGPQEAQRHQPPGVERQRRVDQRGADRRRDPLRAVEPVAPRMHRHGEVVHRARRWSWCRSPARVSSPSVT